MSKVRQDPDEAAQQARAELDRLRAEPGGVFGSALARAANHMTAREADPDDKAELWGRRIGRGLSLIGVIVLSYTLGQQLGWW